MGLFAVTTTMRTKSGDTVWYPFDCDYIETIDEFWEELAEDLVIGDRLKVQRLSGGWLRVTERDRVILGKGMVGQVTLMNRDRILAPGQPLPGEAA